MILIDMHMPKNCIECPIHDGEYGWCDLDADIAMNCDDRPDNCPLHEVTADPDTISRKQAIDAIQKTSGMLMYQIDGFNRLDAENIIKNLPPSPSRPQEQRYGYWMRMSDLNESEDDRYKCSCCGNVVHHRDKVFLYTYNSWCGACGADMVSKDAHGAWRIHATEGGAV